VYVVLVVHHAKLMRRIMFMSVPSWAVPYFPTFSYTWSDFWRKVTDHKVCVLIFSTSLSGTFLIQEQVREI